jgi:hypothetical protein
MTASIREITLRPLREKDLTFYVNAQDGRITVPKPNPCGSLFLVPVESSHRSN